MFTDLLLTLLILRSAIPGEETCPAVGTSVQPRESPWADLAEWWTMAVVAGHRVRGERT